MRRWTKAELAIHVRESHPHGQSVTSLDDLKRWRMDELQDHHRFLHHGPAWRAITQLQPHHHGTHGPDDGS